MQTFPPRNALSPGTARKTMTIGATVSPRMYELVNLMAVAECGSVSETVRNYVRQGLAADGVDVDELDVDELEAV